MQASIYRRNYYLIRVNSENKFVNDENHEREIYSETARVINQMISHTKTLLFKVNSLREEIQSFDNDNDELADVDDLLETFRGFQRGIPLTFFSQYPLDNQMAGPFVLRLTKEMSYWLKYLPMLASIIIQIDEIFQEQKKNQAENISLIYFMTIKKIITDSNEYFKRLKAKISQNLHHQQFDESEKQPNIFLVPTFMQSHNSQNLKKIKQGLIERMNQAIGSLYRDLGLVSFEAIDHYIIELAPDVNAELLAKKEGKRNKKVKKEIKAYKLNYADFQDRKRRCQEKKMTKRRKLSNAKPSLNKNNLHNVATSNKSLSNRNSKVLLPSIKSLGKHIDIIQIQPKKKTNNKENHKESKFSIEKHKLVINRYKQNVGLRLKL